MRGGSALVCRSSRTLVIIGALLVAPPTSAAPAAPAPSTRPIDLLTAVPIVVAVSSTVANAAIVPAHLVDGDLGTAWNSRTGDLRGAWIAARVPADARVTTIRMTVGFTRVDPKLGDLFTMNPRIRRVRVLRNGALVTERVLDPAVRTLQDIPIQQPGGDYKIEVVDIAPGTKPSWRELCVSELEIWGTLAPGVIAKPSRPVVRVGSLDPTAAIASTDCVAVMFPKATAGRVTLENGPEVISSATVIPVSSELAVCRVEHTRERRESWMIGMRADEPAIAVYTDTTIELATVMRTPRLTAGGRIAAVTNTVFHSLELLPDSMGVGDVDQEEHTVALTVLPFTAAENALLVDVTERKFGALLNSERTRSTLYRVSLAGFLNILSYESTSDVDHDSHVRSVESCQLVAPNPPAATPPVLKLVCETTATPMEYGARPTTRSSRTVPYTWRGAAYAPR